MAYLPHPLKRYTGYDPGNPDHVAALVRTSYVGGRVEFTYGGERVAYVLKRDADRWLAKAQANAQECQEDRARTLAWRRAQVDAYLAQRATRDSTKQLKMF